MLSLFPSLLSYQQLSPLLIRLVLGAVFLFWAYRAIKNRGGNLFSGATGNHPLNSKIFVLLEGVIAILLIIGLWVQVAALIAAVDLLLRLFGRVQKRAFLTDGVNYYLILFVLALSLMVTGAGVLAFDLPL